MQSISQFLLLITLLLSFQSCDYLFDCQNDTLHSLSGYKFEIPVTLTPIKETYRVGDTISVNIDFSNEVYDRTTEQHYLLENVHFQPNTDLLDITERYKGDTSEFFSSFADFEVIISDKYNYDSFGSNAGAEFTNQFYFYEDDRYQLSFQLIPNKAGLYQFLHYHLFGTALHPVKTFEKQCMLVSFRAHTHLNDGHDGNIELLKESRIPEHYESVTAKPESFYNGGAFVFKVIE